MELSEQETWYWFVNLHHVGRRTRSRLLEQFKVPSELYACPASVIKQLPFLNEGQRNSIIHHDADCVKRGMDKLVNKGIRFIHMWSDDFPSKLTDIPDCPHAIYVRGRLDCLNRPAVSMVGSRNCSSYGGNLAYKIAYELAVRGVTIISGMAKGIDGAAQRGCIAAGGCTCVVLGCGADICYPESNIELYMKTIDTGCIISEYPPGTLPLRGYFPERNRIISGLGDVLMVVEAGKRSGSLITADCALDQGKDVYAVPGRVTDEQSRGCNELIRNGAAVYDGIEDMLEALDVPVCLTDSIYKNSNIALATDEKIVYAELGLEPKHVNSLARETKLPVEKVMEILINLELRHIVRQTTGNYFVVDN